MSNKAKFINKAKQGDYRARRHTLHVCLFSVNNGSWKPNSCQLGALRVPPLRGAFSLFAFPSLLRAGGRLLLLLVLLDFASTATSTLPTVLVFALCRLMLACRPLLWARQRALPFALLECYRCKPSRLREVRDSRCPAGRLALGGRTGGVRRASLLLLVPWLAACTALGTICSNEPTVCDGTYSGTELCAFSPPCLPRRTLTRRGGGST